MANGYSSRQERRKAKEKDTKKRGLIKKILLILSIVFFLILAAGGVAVLAIIQNTPDLNPEMLDTPLSTTIYDQNDKSVTKVFEDYNRTKIDIKDVPDQMKNAVTSIEDRRFYDHFGIDIRRIFGAA